jgi:hypothetical protein
MRQESPHARPFDPHARRRRPRESHLRMRWQRLHGRAVRWRLGHPRLGPWPVRRRWPGRKQRPRRLRRRLLGAMEPRLPGDAPRHRRALQQGERAVRVRKRVVERGVRPGGAVRGGTVDRLRAELRALPAPARPNTAACPTDYASVPQGSACSTDGLSCIYEQGECSCQVPLGGPVQIDGGTGYWGCVPEQGCPFPRARLGSACSGDAMCTYEACSYAQNCQGGVWQAQQEACAGAQ